MTNYLPGGISLKCYAPNGQLRFNYTQEPDLKLVTTDEINCGNATASFELCNYFNKLPLFGDEIVIKDETLGKVCWVGEPDDITKDVGVKASIKCLGYGKTGALDLPYAHGNVIIPANPGNVGNPAGSKQEYPAGTQYATIVSDTLTRCQNIFQGVLDDLTGIQIPEDSRNYLGLAPAQIWNEINAVTNSLATPLLWYVRPDPLGGPIPSLYMRFADFSPRLEVTWDNKLVKVLNDSYERESYINGCTVAFGAGLTFNFPDDVPATRDHTVLPTNHDRDKYVNANNNQSSIAAAHALAQANVGRFGGPLKSTRCTIEVCAGRITAKPDIVPAINTNYPFWLVNSGHGIIVHSMPAGDQPYNNLVKFIVRVTTDYTAGKVTLECGEIQGPSQSIAIMETYLTSRPYQASLSGQPSQPYVDQDTTPVYGPPSSGVSPSTSGPPTQNIEQTALANFIKNTNLGGTHGGTIYDPNKPPVKYDAVIDPRILPDYGIMGNYESDGAAGIKGLIQIIPGRLEAWKLYVLPNPSDASVPNESITIQLYSDYPTMATTLGAPLVLSTAQQASGSFPVPPAAGSSAFLFGQAATIGIKVTSAMSDTTRGFHLTLYGPKSFPDLGATP